MKTYFQRLLKILEHSLMSLDDEKFTELIDDCEATVRSGGKIITSGLGKNVPVCEKFVGTMNSLGMASAFMNTNSATHGDIGIVKSNDLVILLTKSGETTESIYLYHLLEKRNCKIWLLTFRAESTLSKLIDNVILVDLEHEGDMWNIVPNNSTTLNLILLQMLSIRLSKRMDITLEEFKNNHPGGYIGEILK